MVWAGDYWRFFVSTTVDLEIHLFFADPFGNLPIQMFGARHLHNRLGR
jgi:hypothetical protein